MTQAENSAMRRKLRAIGITLNEERNMAFHFQRIGMTHAVIFNNARLCPLHPEPGEEQVMTLILYGYEHNACDWLMEGGTAYPIGEVIDALMK